MSTSVRHYSRGRKLVAMRDAQAGTSRYYHYDHQGTVQCLTDGSGNVTDRFASDAWGVPVRRTGNTPSPLRFLAALNFYVPPSQVSLYVVGTSAYDARIGRFIAHAPPLWRGFPAVEASIKEFTGRVGRAALQQPATELSFDQLSVTLDPDLCNNRGRVIQQLRWLIKPKPPVRGAIVQRVTRTQKWFDCNDNPIQPQIELRNDALVPVYWEAWPIEEGVLGRFTPPGFTKPVNVGQFDNFVISVTPLRDTKGMISMTGVSWLSPDAIRTSKSNPRGPFLYACIIVLPGFVLVSPAGDLPCTTAEDPEVRLPGHGFPKELVLNWNCCGCKPSFQCISRPNPTPSPCAGP